MFKRLLNGFLNWVERLWFVYSKRSDERRRDVLLALIDETMGEISKIQHEKEYYELQLRRLGSNCGQTYRIIDGIEDRKFKIERLAQQIVAYEMEVAQLDDSLKLLEDILKYREPRPE